MAILLFTIFAQTVRAAEDLPTTLYDQQLQVKTTSPIVLALITEFYEALERLKETSTDSGATIIQKLKLSELKKKLMAAGLSENELMQKYEDHRLQTFTANMQAAALLKMPPSFAEAIRTKNSFHLAFLILQIAVERNAQQMETQTVLDYITFFKKAPWMSDADKILLEVIANYLQDTNSSEAFAKMPSGKAKEIFDAANMSKVPSVSEQNKEYNEWSRLAGFLRLAPSSVKELAPTEYLNLILDSGIYQTHAGHAHLIALLQRNDISEEAFDKILVYANWTLFSNQTSNTFLDVVLADPRIEAHVREKFALYFDVYKPFAESLTHKDRPLQFEQIRDMKSKHLTKVSLTWHRDHKRIADIAFEFLKYELLQPTDWYLLNEKKVNDEERKSQISNLFLSQLDVIEPKYLNWAYAYIGMDLNLSNLKRTLKSLPDQQREPWAVARLTPWLYHEHADSFYFLLNEGYRPSPETFERAISSDEIEFVNVFLPYILEDPNKLNHIFKNGFSLLDQTIFRLDTSTNRDFLFALIKRLLAAGIRLDSPQSTKSPYLRVRAFSESARTDIFDLLLARKDPVQSLVDLDGNWTPLLLAAEYNLESVQYFVAHGANVNARYRRMEFKGTEYFERESVLDAALSHRQYKIFKYLIQSGASVDDFIRRQSHLKKYYDYALRSSLWSKEVQDNTKNRTAYTALMDSKDPELVRIAEHPKIVKIHNEKK